MRSGGVIISDDNGLPTGYIEGPPGPPGSPGPQGIKVCLTAYYSVIFVAQKRVCSWYSFH